MSDNDPLVGVTVEILSAIILPVDLSSNPYDPVSRFFERGDLLTLDETVLDAAVLADQHGASLWVKYLDDADAQVAHYGRPVFRRLVAGEAVAPWDGPRDQKYKAAYFEALRALRALPAGPERLAQQREFAIRFPQAPTDNQELMRYLR